MTIGEPGVRAERVPRTPLGRVAGLALLVAPLLLGAGGLAGGAGWLDLGLAYAGLALLVGATLTVHSLRGSFTDEIAEQPSVAVRLGDTWTRRLYLGLVAAAYLTLAALALREPWTAIALLTALVMAFPAHHVVIGAIGPHLNPVVRDTALVCVHYAALVALGFVLS